MTYKECYKIAVANVSRYMDSMKKSGIEYTAFDGSIALAVCFHFTKEKTLKDLIKYRRKQNE